MTVTQTNPFDGLPRLAFIIGAQKAGTTFLAGLLDQHPEICLSTPKEPQFFTARFDRGLEFYASRFVDPSGSVLLDASTTYTMLRPQEFRHLEASPGNPAPVPERIYALNPDARLIYVLRDPADRAASAYRHMLRSKTLPSGPVSLMDCLREQPIIEIASRYSAQIERYLEFFPIANMHFIPFGDLNARPRETADACFDFLGIGPHETTTEMPDKMRNAAFSRTGLGRMAVGLKRRAPKTIRRLNRMLPERAQGLVGRALRKEGQTIRFADMDDVRAHFDDERRKTRDLTGLEI